MKGVFPKVKKLIQEAYRAAKDKPADWQPQPERFDPTYKIICTDGVVWAHSFMLYAGFKTIERTAVWGERMQALEGSPRDSHSASNDGTSEGQGDARTATGDGPRCIVGDGTTRVDFPTVIVRSIIDIAYGITAYNQDESMYEMWLQAVDYLGVIIKISTLRFYATQWCDHRVLLETTAQYAGELESAHNVTKSCVVDLYKDFVLNRDDYRPPTRCRYDVPETHEVVRNILPAAMQHAWPYSDAAKVREFTADALPYMDIIWLTTYCQDAASILGYLRTYMTTAPATGFYDNLTETVRVYMDAAREYLRAAIRHAKRGDGGSSTKYYKCKDGDTRVWPKYIAYLRALLAIRAIAYELLSDEAYLELSPAIWVYRTSDRMISLQDDSAHSKHAWYYPYYYACGSEPLLPTTSSIDRIVTSTNIAFNDDSYDLPYVDDDEEPEDMNDSE